MPIDRDSTATARLLTIIAGGRKELIALAVNRHTVSYDRALPLVRWATAQELSFLDEESDGAWLLETGAVPADLCRRAGLLADGQLSEME